MRWPRFRSGSRSCEDVVPQGSLLRTDGRRLPRRHVWPQGHWDWPIHLPFKHGLKCGDLIFVGGQVSLDGRGAVIDRLVPAVYAAPVFFHYLNHFA